MRKKFKCYVCKEVKERDNMATILGNKIVDKDITIDKIHNFCSMDCYDKFEIQYLGLYNPVYHAHQNTEINDRPTPLNFERRN